MCEPAHRSRWEHEGDEPLAEEALADETFERELFAARARVLDAEFTRTERPARLAARTRRLAATWWRGTGAVATLAAAACLLARVGAFSPPPSRAGAASTHVESACTAPSSIEVGDPLSCSAESGPASVAAYASSEARASHDEAVAACIAPEDVACMMQRQ